MNEKSHAHISSCQCNDKKFFLVAYFCRVCLGFLYSYMHDHSSAIVFVVSWFIVVGYMAGTITPSSDRLYLTSGACDTTLDCTSFVFHEPLYTVLISSVYVFVPSWCFMDRIFIEHEKKKSGSSLMMNG